MILLYGAPVLNHNETISYHGTFLETATVTDVNSISDQVNKMFKYDVLQSGTPYITHAINVTVNVTPIGNVLLISITGNYVHISVNLFA